MKRLLTFLLVLLIMGWLVPSSAFALRLIVATNEHFPPYEYYETNGYTGFDIEIWDAIAEILPTPYAFKPMPQPTLLGKTAAGEVDLAIAAIAVTAENSRVADFSFPYLQTGLRLLVRTSDASIQSMEDLSGKWIGTVLNSPGMTYLYSQTDHENVSTYQHFKEAWRDLTNGEIDAILYDKNVLDHYAAHEGLGRVAVVGPVLEKFSYAMAFPKNSIYLRHINAALTRLRSNGTYDAIYKKWFGTPAPGN